MKQEIENLKDQEALEVGIGFKIAELLNLKVNKTTGKLNTSWGTKSIKGLGACVIRIVEEETERLK